LKQRTISNESDAVLIDASVSIPAEEDSSVFENLSVNLAQIRKLKGVMGYILRSNSSAIIDLEDSENVIPYAMFCSQTLESCQEIARLFSMGEAESMIVEGRNVKVLCMKLGENKINVFMENSAAHASIIEKLML
jgi:predicted regulator of Ras-like GTPase activity (Roadblock/LC7/MglB family)